MTASPNLSHSHSIRKSGVLVLNGWGIRIKVEAGHLLLHDGIADERRTIRLPRVNHGLKRLVLIGSDGFVTLEALRWISDAGASFLMLDRRGKVLVVTGPVTPSDSKLRRAQALALGNGTALKISKELISQKLAGQELLVRDMLHDPSTADAIARFRSTLPSTESVERVTLIEAQAAKLYWHSWADIPILWPRNDEKLVPGHWKKFGSRISPITHSPRLAASPSNALLNFVYSLLEAEARLAATAMGLDVGQGFLHMDTPNRDSLACDLMEVCRPGGVDAFVLNWLQSEPLRKSDFWEDRNGNCRISSALAIKLCETSDTWRRLVAPIAEYVAQEIWNSVSKPTSTSKLIATRLTQRNKREATGHPSFPPTKPAPQPESICRVCGTSISFGRSHCSECDAMTARERIVEIAKIGRVASQAPGPKARRAQTQRQHAIAKKEWRPSSLPPWLDEEVYTHKIQPLLAGVANPVIMSALGVSVTYSVAIRAGRRRPHQRHWLKLAELVGVSADGQ
ncbi:MAG: CRISPR-associated endonuclease Cas1 [Candidatus Sulfotelmatobacter sp.]